MTHPKHLSFVAALVITVIITVGLAFFFICNALLFVVSAFVFSVSFIVIHIIIEKFIYKKIQSLHASVKYEIAATENTATSKNALGNLKNALQLWSRERKEEISRLKKLENYRKEFLGNVSHELKTPVFNIQGYILTLLDGGLEDKNINRDYLQRAEKSVGRMIGIIEDLESITQLETGELHLEIEKFDIALLAKEIIDALEMKANEKGIRLMLGKYDENPVFISGDKFRIRQVLLNLIDNSIKYGKQHGETKVNFRDAGSKVIVEIADNGIGIDKQHLPRIFERFYRIDKSRSREAGGTGLGLSIVEHIIEAHGENISVLSTPEVGTVFSFPLKKGNA